MHYSKRGEEEEGGVVVVVEEEEVHTSQRARRSASLSTVPLLHKINISS